MTDEQPDLTRQCDQCGRHPWTEWEQEVCPRHWDPQGSCDGKLVPTGVASLTNEDIRANRQRMVEQGVEFGDPAGLDNLDVVEIREHESMADFPQVVEAKRQTAAAEEVAKELEELQKDPEFLREQVRLLKERVQTLETENQQLREALEDPHRDPR